MKILKTALLGIAMLLSIASIAQDKKKEMERSTDPEWNKRMDSDIKEKLEHGDYEKVKAFLPGYYKRMEDPHSYAKKSDAVIKHLDLDLTIDFTSKTFNGKARLEVENLGGDMITLDVKDLQIKSVSIDGEKNSKFELGQSDEILGQSMTIPLSEPKSTIEIEYQTMGKAEAIQWLSADQAGTEQPFVYTQGEPILTRTWIPIQDSPGIKFTYSATIRVPDGITPVMSATSKKLKDNVYQFNQTNPIPAYLIALAAGELEFRSISEKCGVYAVPEIVDEAAKEFVETPKMIMLAEQIAGPYVWDRYDILVMPRAFPFGGMENPMMTFVTPTIISGDRSLVSLIAHELAHSWSGNLVTNSSWNDFWLNEGLTVYLERRIVQELRGKVEAGIQAYNGYSDLISTMKDLDKHDCMLKLNLEGRDPDDGMTDVAYEKGALFLNYLESRTSRQQVEEMLRSFFETYKFKSVSTEEFLSHAKTHLSESVLTEKVINEWVYGTTVPSKFPKPKQLGQIDQDLVQMMKFMNFPAERLEKLSVSEWIYLMDNLEPHLLDYDFVKNLGVYKKRLTSNSEVQFRWYKLCAQTGYAPEQEGINTFLSTVGRRKFLVPLYKALSEHTDNPNGLKKTYMVASVGYHSITQKTLDRMLGVSKKERNSISNLKY